MLLTRAERQEVMGSTLFREVPPSIVERILSEQNTVVQSFKAEHLIFRGEDPTPNLGYLLTGYAVVRQAPATFRDEYKETYVNMVRPGGLFGVERCFIDRQDMTYVETLSPARVLRINGKLVRNYAKGEAPSLWRNLGECLADISQESNELLEVLQARGLNESLLKLLQFFSRKYGNQIERGIDTKLTATTVADMLGCNTSTLSRISGALRDSGYITYFYANGTLHFRLEPRALALAVRT